MNTDPTRGLSPILVIVALLVGVGLRIWVLTTPLGRLDADEAGVGLMARHALHGEFPAFFWGQSYGGAQESLMAAGLFGLSGSSVVSMKVIPIGLHALGVWLLWRLGRHTVG